MIPIQLYCNGLKSCTHSTDTIQRCLNKLSIQFQAIKNHYLLIQISDILRQLLENGSGALKELKAGIKEISSRILESFRRDTLTLEDISQLNQHIKIRDL